MLLVVIIMYSCYIPTRKIPNKDHMFDGCAMCFPWQNRHFGQADIHFTNGNANKALVLVNKASCRAEPCPKNSSRNPKMATNSFRSFKMPDENEIWSSSQLLNRKKIH